MNLGSRKKLELQKAVEFESRSHCHPSRGLRMTSGINWMNFFYIAEEMTNINTSISNQTNMKETNQ